MKYLIGTLLLANVWSIAAAPAGDAPANDALSGTKTLESRQKPAPAAFPYPPGYSDDQCPYPSGHPNAWANIGFEPRDLDHSANFVESRDDNPSQGTLNNDWDKNGNLVDSHPADLDKRTSVGTFCNEIAEMTLTNIPANNHNTPAIGILLRGIDLIFSWGLDTVVERVVIWASYASNPQLSQVVARGNFNSISGSIGFQLASQATVHAYITFANQNGPPVNGAVAFFASNLPNGLIPIGN